MKRSIWFYVFLGLFLAALGNALFCAYGLHKNFEGFRKKLMRIASDAAASIDVDSLLGIPLESDADKTPEYKSVYAQLEKVKNVNPVVKYIYIMTTTDTPGVLQYIIDADPLPKIVTAKSPTAFSGDKYDARGIPEMLEAYYGPSADKKVYSDIWGTTISGYAPIYANTGGEGFQAMKNVVAILGVDVDAAQIRAQKKKLLVLSVIALLAGICVLMAFKKIQAK